MTILVLTRPREASRRFLADVQEKMGVEIRSIISPVIEIEYLPASVDVVGKALVFTSVHGVEGAKQLGFASGTPAFCVGDKTAEAATLAGFSAHSARGDARALVDLVKQIAPRKPLVHVHGAHTRGEVAEHLSASGIKCESIVTYAQVAQAPTETLLAALNGTTPLLVPLFSPRSALIFGMVDEITAPLHVIAMSAAVAAEVADFGADTVRVAEKPDGPSMVAATCHRLFELLGPSLA